MAGNIGGIYRQYTSSYGGGTERKRRGNGGGIDMKI